MRSSSVSYETYPDPSDVYLIRTLMEKYTNIDVRGYGSRLRMLRRDFLYCSLHRALELRRRFSGREPKDQLSQLFHHRPSHGRPAILLPVLSLPVLPAPRTSPPFVHPPPAPSP